MISDEPETPVPEVLVRRHAGITIAGLALAALIGICVGSAAYTFNFAEGTSYLSNDPKACVNCHIMRDQYDGWQKAPHHANATCNDCHVPHDFIGKYYTKAEHGWRHSKGFTLQNFHEPVRITPESLGVVNANCVRCHEGLVSAITEHTDPVRGLVNCTQCHARVGHGPRN